MNSGVTALTGLVLLDGPGLLVSTEEGVVAAYLLPLAGS